VGEIVDMNTRYIARTLRGMGVNMFRIITIGDNVERIAEDINHSMQRAEIVITTGGLGPTVDNPTREAVAKAAGLELEFRQDLWEQVVAIISRYGRKPSENQKRQAYIPKGAIAIPNPVGTAPCLIVETERNAVASLPGVPNERERLGDIVFGADEEKLEEVVLNEVAKRGWTLVRVESGLDGLLARKIPHTISVADL
jgi:molybdenum cofactor synthesis domain-containing protein